MEMKGSSSPNEKTEFLLNSSTEGQEETARESPKERRLRYAALIGIIIGTTLGPQNDGIASTWPNVFASDLETDQSTLLNTSLHVSDWEMDFMSSSYFIGTLPVIVFSGWLVSWLGRRRSMILCSIPGAISWMLMGIAPTVPVVLAGRFFCGASHGLQGIAVRSYLAEISDDRIRGAAGVTTESMKGIGGILIIALGIFMPWYYTAIFGAFHFLFYGILVVPCLPESPSYLIVKGREEEAIKVLRKLRGPYVDHKDMVEALKKENERADGSTGWRVLFKPDILKRYFIVAGLFFIANFSGVEVIRGNATRMLQSSGVAFDKDISTMIVFVVLLSGNISQTLILDWIGRRKCLVLSLLLLVAAYTVLGTYIFLNTSDIETTSLTLEQNMTIANDIRSEHADKWKWIPTASLMTVAFGSSLGIGPIPWLLSTEYFPTTIRPQIVDNVLREPSSEKYRSVKLNDKIVEEKLIPAVGAMEILFLMGFVEDGDRLTLPRNDSLDKVRQYRQQLLQLKRDRTKSSPTGKSNPRALPYALLESESRFRLTLKSLFKHVLIYEDPAVQEKARQVLPIQELHEETRNKLAVLNEGLQENDKPLDFQDCLFRALLAWFENDFFKWFDGIKCPQCQKKMTASGRLTPTRDDRTWGAVNVEGYTCNSCGTKDRFPRYNHPVKLLETRRGRCGEWTNCFVLLCRTLDLDVRYVHDHTDHVWAEFFSQSQNRWLHADCGNILDNPLMYEKGWGKKLNYIIAFSKDEIMDVTWRYTANPNAVRKRRRKCREPWLVSTILELNKQRQASFPDAKKRELECRRVSEIVEFLKPLFAKK